GDTEGELTKIAAQAGMDKPAFDACLQRQDLLDLINANVDEAEQAYKIPGTPSFVLDGDVVRIGSFDDLAEKIDAALGDDAPAE
ncbi:MAG: thioredoxin domain-containing protein, partial [Pseudomonadota bacterium]